MFTPANQASLIAFVSIVIFVITALLAGIHFSAPPHARMRTTLLAGFCIAVWLGIVSWSVVSGFLEAEPMPRVMVFLALCNLVGIALAVSTTGGRMAATVPLGLLVGFQVFRLPLEIVLHSWGTQGTIPTTMTWAGSNFDVISGVTALLCAPFAARYRTVAWLANGIGFALLINVIRVAILSSPFPFSWQVDPPLLLVFHLPYALIVPVCVAGALAGHIILTRALLTKA